MPFPRKKPLQDFIYRYVLLQIAAICLHICMVVWYLFNGPLSGGLASMTWYSGLACLILLVSGPAIFIICFPLPFQDLGAPREHERSSDLLKTERIKTVIMITYVFYSLGAIHAFIYQSEFMGSLMVTIGGIWSMKVLWPYQRKIWRYIIFEEGERPDILSPD